MHDTVRRQIQSLASIPICRRRVARHFVQHLKDGDYSAWASALHRDISDEITCFGLPNKHVTSAQPGDGWKWILKIRFAPDGIVHKVWDSILHRHHNPLLGLAERVIGIKIKANRPLGPVRGHGRAGTSDKYFWSGSTARSRSLGVENTTPSNIFL